MKVTFDMVADPETAGEIVKVLASQQNFVGDKQLFDILDQEFRQEGEDAPVPVVVKLCIEGDDDLPEGSEGRGRFVEMITKLGAIEGA